MATHFFVDAYNVMLKSSLLREAARLDLERARDMLLDYVQCFCLSGDHQVTVVFDGREQERSGAGTSLTGKVPGVHILFSPHQSSADSVIERLIYQQNNRMNCVVVSNDRSLRDQCRGMGTLTMEADSFINTVRQVQNSAREHLSRREHTQALLLEDQLSENNLRTLQALRDKLADNQPKSKGKPAPRKTK